MSGQVSMLDYSGRVIAPRAPEGVKRAGVAGGRVDLTLLEVAARHVGTEVAIPTVHVEVEAAGVVCLQDTVRRRLKALAEEGHLRLGQATRTGHVKIDWVRT